MVEISLDQVPLGKTLRILRLESKPGVSVRLNSLGVSPGVEIKPRQKLPFGGPLVVEVLSTSIALRFDEAKLVWGELV